MVKGAALLPCFSTARASNLLRLRGLLVAGAAAPTANISVNLTHSAASIFVEFYSVFLSLLFCSTFLPLVCAHRGEAPAALRGLIGQSSVGDENGLTLPVRVGSK